MRAANTKVILAIGLSVITYAILILGTVRSWNPSLSHDTFVYYYPRITQTAQEFDTHGFGSVLKVPYERIEPDAADAKPIFVLIIKAWHAVYAMLNPGSLPYPNNQVFSDFVSFTLVLLFGSICWLGVVLGNPWVGILSAWCSMLSPWMITATLFSTYTAPSLSILIWTIIALIHDSPRPAVSGTLTFTNLFVNQSMTVFAIACLAFIFCPRFVTRKDQLRNLVRFAAGFLLVWLTLEGIIFLQRVQSGQEWLFLWQILKRYLNRSLIERSEFFVVYDGGLLFYVLWQHSKIFTFTLLAGLAAICYSAARSRLFLDPRYKALVVFCLMAVFVIDARVGPKFSRTYVLLLPFITLLSVRCVAQFVKPRQAKTWVVGVLVLSGFIFEQGTALVRMEHAFLDVRRSILNLSKTGPIFVAANDTYLPFFKQLVENNNAIAKMELFSDLCELRNLSRLPSYVVVGPNRKSVLNLPAWHTDETDLPLPNGNRSKDVLTGACPDGYLWKAEKVQMLSFFSHYPFLLLEDPRETFRLIASKETRLSDYYRGSGRVTLWRVSFIAPSK
jgi:hypothetical protein